MKKYLNLLGQNLVFQNIPQDTLLSILSSDACNIKNFPAGKIIYEPGQSIRYTGILLDGLIDIVHLSASGHDTIVSRILPGGMFGESFSCALETNYFNEIRCTSSSVILFLDLYALLRQDSLPVSHHRQLTENIIHTLAKGNVWLNTKMLILTQKTLRDKILTYFETLAAQNHSNAFTLPFNREQLASFLGSERSSLSRELSRMQEEGLLTVNRDFIILH